jgi:hypothetical protein
MTPEGQCFAAETPEDAEAIVESPDAVDANREPPTETPPPDPKADSRQHFQSGLNLYEDRNYAAALAEFEAAYRQFPSAAALQDVALCQKQLYRYSEARETLIRLAREHRTELDAKELVAVNSSIAELSSLIGSVRLSVVPADAKILLDGHTVSRTDAEKPVVLDVGEHQVSAEAPGFAPMVRSFRIAGGHADVPLSLVLTETTGTVVVTAPDAQTAIAVDGRAVAFAEWTGRLDPGRHFVQVYREGYEPFEEEIDVEVGSSLHVKGLLGDKLDRVDAASDPQGANRRPQLGAYGLLGAMLFVPRGHPAGFLANTDYDIGWSMGLRAGYRLLPPIAVEAAFDSGSFAVKGHCTDPSPSACPTTTESTYHLDARRIGAGLRLFSSSETIRLTLVAAGGIVSHDFRDAMHKAAGLDPYVTFEAGVQANWRHSLWELVLVIVRDGASSIKRGDYRPYAEASGIDTFGLSLRIGWGDWTPSRPPLPPMPKPVAIMPPN